MKKGFFVLIAAMLAAIVSVGCSSSNAGLENKINQLEQQLNSQANSSQGTSSVPESSSVPSQSASAQASSQTGNFDLTELTQKVDAAVQKADSAQRQATYQENVSLYSQIKLQLKQVELELDQFEDQIEYACRSGSLPYDRYLSLDNSVEMLDKRLDFAEDSLELRLGVDY